jgi:triosephosphate isomerase (TIM)
MNARKPFIAGNWKMYKTCREAEQTASEIVRLTSGLADIDVLIAPAYTALAGVGRIIASTHVFLSAQNLFWEKEGPYTGEISASMLVDTGCSHVIIGHSERRQYFGETDETVNKKIATAMNAGLIPVFCVGETEKERDAGQTFYVLDKQIKKGLEGFSFENALRLVIAYEPVWAIGTGKTATRDQAQEAHHFLRGLLEELFGKMFADTVRILYGGSVKPGNIKELMDMPDVDGALVGGASLDAETFSAIVHYKK